MSSRVLATLLSLALFSWGCGDDDGTTDAGRDDAGTVDGGGTSDGGGDDTGRTDGGVDAGSEGEVVRASLGAAGGSLTSADGVFELVIPAGALDETEEISIRVVPRAEWPSEAANADPIAGVYDVQPDGLEFAVPALGVHQFASRPAALDAPDGALTFVGHLSRSDAGELETMNTLTAYATAGVLVVAELEHLSVHWASTLWTTRTTESRVAIELPSGPFEVGSVLTPVSVGLDLESAATLTLSAASSNAGVWRPTAHDGGGTVLFNPFEYVAAAFGAPLTDGRREESPTVDVLAGRSSAPPPLPSFTCDRAGEAQLHVQANLEAARPFANVAVTRIADVPCTEAASPITRVAVSPNPELARVWTDGTLIAVGNPPAGFATHTAVTSSGTRFTQTFAQPAYDFILYPGSTTTNLWGAGPMNEWVTNFSSTEFLGTGLGRNGNFTSVRRFPQMGTPMRFGLASFGLSLITVYGADRVATGNVVAGQFTGGAWPAPPISFDFAPLGANLLFALGNGNVYFGAPNPTGATPTAGSVSIVDTGDPEDDPRFVRCFENSSDLHVCAIAAFGADEIHVYEVTQTMARKTAEIAVGDGPIDPAVIADGVDSVLIAVGGSNDDSFTLLRYAPSTEVLTQVGDTVTLDDCDQPNHANFATPTDLLVSCFGSSVVLRFDPMDLVL